MPGQKPGIIVIYQKTLTKALERETNVRMFVNRRFSKQKLVNACQSMENYFYICPA